MRKIGRVHPVAVVATVIPLLVVSCTSSPAGNGAASAGQAVCEDAIGDQIGTGTDRLAPGQDEPWEGGDIERLTLTVDDDTVITEWTMAHDVATDLTDDVSASWVITFNGGDGLWIRSGHDADEEVDPATFRAAIDADTMTPVDIPVEVDGRRLVARWPLDMLNPTPNSWEAYTTQDSPPGFLAEIQLVDDCPGTIEQPNESTSPIPWPD